MKGQRAHRTAAAVALFACGLAVSGATAQTTAAALPSPSPPAATQAQPGPDESVLGTVQVTGGAAAPLPKLAIVPVVTTIDEDTTVQLVVRKDLDLSGQFEVDDENAAPKGLYLHETPVDPAPWRAKGVEILVRALANRLPSGKIELLATAYLLGHGAAPVFEHRSESDAATIRLSAHRMADALLGALSGRPGGFASHMVYSGRVGSGRQIFGIDADGFNLHAESPAGDTALAPTFGPEGRVYYALSHNFEPFRVVSGANAKVLPIAVPGSVYGLAFSADHAKLALAIASGATSRIYTGAADGTGLTAASTASLANHPVFGPGGKLAYVAGGQTGQRIYVDGKPISPAGFNASAPAFCDTPNGLLVVFTVGVGSGADLVATDTRGGNIQRLTQNQGANSYPSCSPDGRLLSFFSTRKSDKGPGLYIAPIANTSRTRRISRSSASPCAGKPSPRERGRGGPHAPPPPGGLSLEGVLDRVTYTNEENAWSVVKIAVPRAARAGHGGRQPARRLAR